MARIAVINSGSSGSRNVQVWDPLVRLIHWSIALGILINSFSQGDAELHQCVGYAATLLVCIRLIWGLVGPGPARFTAFPPSASRALAHLRALMRGNRSAHLSHNPMGAWMVYNIWASILLIGTTGLLMEATAFQAPGWAEELHEILYNWLVFSIALHLAGVIFDTYRTRVPLIRAMITGRKTIPEGDITE